MSMYERPPVRYSETPPTETWSGAKERGGCLTAWLVFATFVNVVFGTIGICQLLTDSSISRIINRSAPLLIPALIGQQIAIIAGLIGMWNWKRWGVYTVVGAILFGGVLSLVYGDGLRGVLIPAGQLALLYYLLNSKWDYFEA